MAPPIVSDTELLREIDRFLRERNYAVSVRELMTFAGNSSPQPIHERLRRFRKRGLVDWLEQQPRTLHLTPAGRALIDA